MSDQPAGVEGLVGRSLLGPADVSDEELAGLDEAQLRFPGVEVLSCEVETADYDLASLTTAGRYWVRGTARHPGGTLMLVFWGLSAVPLEVLFGMAPPGPAPVVRERARAATFVLDLVEATSRR